MLQMWDDSLDQNYTQTSQSKTNKNKNRNIKARDYITKITDLNQFHKLPIMKKMLKT